MHKGFTLVELSMVLVIIGLLVGGILIGQSMISTTKTLRYVTLFSSYDAAFNNFKTKYSSLPGDSKFLVPQGNGDGTIGGAQDLRQNSALLLNAERTAALNQLVASGFFPDGAVQAYTAPGGNIVVGTNVPQIDKKVGLIIYTDSRAALRPALFVSQMDGLAYGSSYDNPNQYLKGESYFALESKIDDGNALTGKLYGYGDPCNHNPVMNLCVLAVVVCQPNINCDMSYMMEQ